MEETQLQELKGKNWMAAMSLCWFLGMYGAHRFYTGKTHSGWVMVVLTVLGITAPISAIWALIDGFRLALGRYTHDDGSELYERVDWFGYIYIALMVLCAIALLLYFTAIIGMIAMVAHSAAGAGAMPPTP